MIGSGYGIRFGKMFIVAVGIILCKTLCQFVSHGFTENYLFGATFGAERPGPNSEVRIAFF